jgi:hypothetical protein
MKRGPGGGGMMSTNERQRCHWLPMKTSASLSTGAVNEIPSIHEQSGNSVYPASRYLRPRQTPNIGSTQVSKPSQMQPAHKVKHPCRITL